MSPAFYYVEILLKDGRLYRNINAELGTGGLAERWGTQGIWLPRYGCMEFVPGEEVESICWKRAIDPGNEESAELQPEPELELVNV